MATVVSGTFSGTGQSSVITGSRFTIKMDFAGTATVQVQALMGASTWVQVGSDYTADTVQVCDFGGSLETIRLNCSAHTNNVVYEMRVGHEQ